MTPPLMEPPYERMPISTERKVTLSFRWTMFSHHG
jgi:hypothetical protein